MQAFERHRSCPFRNGGREIARALMLYRKFCAGDVISLAGGLQDVWMSGRRACGPCGRGAQGHAECSLRYLMAKTASPAGFPQQRPR